MAQKWSWDGWDSSDSEDREDLKSDTDPETKLRVYIKWDHVWGFVDVIRNALEVGAEHGDGIYFKVPSSSRLLKRCFRHRASKCAKALLEGRTGIEVDLPKSGFFPLHYAAQFLSPDLTQLLLRRGVPADLRCNNDRLDFNGLLPLNVAVETLSQHIRWTPKHSVFKLVVELFERKLKGAMDTISMLVKETPDVEQVIYHYAEEGKLVELAALLKVARLKIMREHKRFTYESENGCSVDGRMELRRCVAIELASIIDEEYRLMGNRSCNVAHTCKEKKSVMESVMLLLEIFQRLGCSVEIEGRWDYQPYEKGVAEGIASALMYQDFPMTEEDTYYFEEKCIYDDAHYLINKKWREDQRLSKGPPSWVDRNLFLPSYLLSHSLLNRKRHRQCENYVCKEMEEDQSHLISKDEDRVKEIITHDYKDEFMAFLKESLLINSGDLVKLKFGETEFCPYKLLGWICQYHAVHCGTALLEEKTGLKMDLNILNNQGSSLLHGASSLLAGLIELFLRHEADIRCNAVDLDSHGLFPLHIAIERVSSDKNLIQWTPRQSIFKLIIILCLPEMKEALETVRLLALNTKEIKEVIRYYAKEGGLIELAILLIVAKEKVIDPIVFPSKDDDSPKICMTFRQCIKSELGALIDYEYRLMGRMEQKMTIQRCKEWKEAMMSTLLLLEIFERAGAAIGAYVLLNRTNTPKEQIAQELASLLAEAGFNLSSNDTDLSDIVDWCTTEPAIQSCHHVYELEEKPEEPTEHGSQEQNIHTPPHSQPINILNNNPKHGMANAHWWLIRTPFQRESSVLSSALQPFHASWTAKASFCSGFPIVVKVEVKERIRGKDLYMRNFVSRKRLASFALVAKRGIRW